MLDFARYEATLLKVGQFILRYSLVFFFVALGLYKFTPEEAEAIKPLMEHSLLLFWLNPTLGDQGASALIGVFEIAFGSMIAVRRFAPRISALGSLGAAFALVNTLSFLFTTPGLDPASADAGFLLKDLTLLGAALWTAGEALSAAATKRVVTFRDPAAGHG